MVDLVQAMNHVEFPAMRLEVAAALASLADPGYQVRAWLEHRFEAPGAYEDLSMVLHILYDDIQVLPDPSRRIGSVLISGAEVDALGRLAGPLTAVVDRLGDVEVVAYLDAPEWPQIVDAASIALASMVRAGGFDWHPPG